MKFNDLKQFILEDMLMEKGHNYQPVMIRTLLKNKGKATEDQIKTELHNANPLYPVEYFNNSPVFKVLTEEHPVTKYDKITDMYELLDYDDYSKQEKEELESYCNHKIENPKGKIQKIDLDNIILEFREWLQTDEAQNHLKVIESEKQEVKELMQKLDKMDKFSIEFTDWVLYGLLPQYKSKYAKRLSHFPTFLNIKKFFKNYNYTEQDWNKIANMIFGLAKDFQKSPEKLEQHIQNFISEKRLSRMLQTGSLTPILFCINDSFPLINNRIRHTYKDFSLSFDWDDKMSQKIEDYSDGIAKCKKLINFIGIDEFKNLAVFDLFCYWWDSLREKEIVVEERDDEEEYESKKTEFDDVDYSQFVKQLDLENNAKFLPHSLPNPERITIQEIIQNCERGKWQLPNFQRYFDWKKTDIQDLLKSIFLDNYIGSLLLWRMDKEPPVKLIPIHGAKLPQGENRTELIILDGQQRVTSLYYAIRSPGITTRKIRKPVYFYFNFKKFLEGVDEKIVVILSEKLPRDQTIKKMLFPIYEIENYRNWVDDFEDKVSPASSDDYNKVKKIRRIMDDKLHHFIDGFEVPYITLPATMEIDQVTDIFEKINTRGKLLSVFDLLIARLSLYGIELKELWEEVISDCPKLKEYNSSDKIPIYILQSVALSYGNASTCKRQDILNIFDGIFEPKGMIFDDIWRDTAKYVNSAILRLENLRDGFGVKDRGSLPFLSIIPILASLLREIDLRTNKRECNSKLNTWYWSSVFSEAYSGAVDTQLSTDFRDMRKWFDDETKTPRTVERIRREFVATINLREIKSDKNAIYRGVMSLLALEGAPDFNTGLSLENAPENDQHHIFPKSVFKNSTGVNSILNMTWLSDDTNRKIIGARRPSVYIAEFIHEKYGGNKKEFFKVLQKHFVNEQAFEYMLNDDMDNFIMEREKIIMSKIAQIFGVQTETPTQTLLSPSAPFDNELLIEDSMKKCDGYIHWVDRYFRTKGLKWLARYLPKQKVKEVKILTSIDTADDELRDLFKSFKTQMLESGISCEMRVIVDNKLKGQIHGRWLISKNDCFSFQSVDTVSRGAYDEIRGGASRPPFKDWWDSSLDIVQDWNKIQTFRK